MTIKRSAILCAVFAIMLTCSCESRWGSAGLGAAGGAVAAGGGYEYRANREMNRIEQEYRDGIIDQREFEIRRDQIQRMAILE